MCGGGLLLHITYLIQLVLLVFQCFIKKQKARELKNDLNAEGYCHGKKKFFFLMPDPLASGAKGNSLADFSKIPSCGSSSFFTKLIDDTIT